MKINKNISILLVAIAALCGCNKFLDKEPDSRTELDELSKIDAVLGSAYPDHTWFTLGELMSDNIDNYSHTTYNKGTRFHDQVFNWEDVTESNNESPESLWSCYYGMAATANGALEALEALGSPDDPTYSETYGEAYLCRAYAFFELANIFCMPYTARTCDKELGLPYMTTQEKDFTPQYERGTLSELYSKIDEDLKKGLALVGDSRYSVPKYHFNTQAAYAFATRFYLYYEKWDKAIECANKALGSAPATLLRDYAAIQALPSNNDSGYLYASSSSPCNFLIGATFSYMYGIYANYSTYNSYSHGAYVAATEGVTATNIFGSNSMFIAKTHTYSGSMDRVIFWRVPYLFEYTDPVAHTGRVRGLSPLFTADECLLNRAEAYVMSGKYDEACADLNIWMHNFTTYTEDLTLASIKDFYNRVKYATWIDGTVKKHLHRDDIGEEGGDKESMLQCVLGFKRLETIGFGLRWMDLRRYGIKIYRRYMDATYTPYLCTDEMQVYDPKAGTEADPRWAVQIPYKVRQAGLQPNPRNNS